MTSKRELRVNMFFKEISKEALSQNVIETLLEAERNGWVKFTQNEAANGKRILDALRAKGKVPPSATRTGPSAPKAPSATQAPSAPKTPPTTRTGPSAPKAPSTVTKNIAQLAPKVTKITGIAGKGLVSLMRGAGWVGAALTAFQVGWGLGTIVNEAGLGNLLQSWFTPDGDDQPFIVAIDNVKDLILSAEKSARENDVERMVASLQRAKIQGEIILKQSDLSPKGKQTMQQFMQRIDHMDEKLGAAVAAGAMAIVEKNDSLGEGEAPGGNPKEPQITPEKSKVRTPHKGMLAVQKRINETKFAQVPENGNQADKTTWDALKMQPFGLIAGRDFTNYNQLLDKINEKASAVRSPPPSKTAPVTEAISVPKGEDKLFALQYSQFVKSLVSKHRNDTVIPADLISQYIKLFQDKYPDGDKEQFKRDLQKEWQRLTNWKPPPRRG